MGRCAVTDEREAGDSRVGLDSDGGSGLDLPGGDGVDTWAANSAAVAVEKVGGNENLGVEVVRGATGAETTTTNENGGVLEQERPTVVRTRGGVGNQFLESIVIRVPELRLVNGASVREGVADSLATSDEDLAIWKDSGAGKYTLVPHSVDVLNVDSSI